MQETVQELLTLVDRGADTVNDTKAAHIAIHHIVAQHIAYQNIIVGIK